jgi:tetratricopeptide (TPR) repeat protein
LQMEKVSSKNHVNPARPTCFIQIAFMATFVLALEGRQGADAQVLSGEVLQKEIQVYSAASLRADPPEMEPVAAGRIWWQLGSLYEDAARYAESEGAYEHAIRLLRSVPSAKADLAYAIDGLGTLYMMRGDPRQGERAEREALAIREANGLSADLPRSWYNLAALSLREHRFGKAREYAQRALAQLGTENSTDAGDELNAQFALGSALCRLHRYRQAVGVMQNAMKLVQQNYRPEDFATGFGSFLLGYAYWKSGNTNVARNWMASGAAAVQKQLGWKHPVCVIVMTQYVHFLRKTHQTRAAGEIEDNLKSAGGAAEYRPEPGTPGIAAPF